MFAAGVRLGRSEGMGFGHVDELDHDAARLLRLEPMGEGPGHRSPQDRSRLLRPRSRRIFKVVDAYRTFVCESEVNPIVAKGIGSRTPTARGAGLVWRQMMIASLGT